MVITRTATKVRVAERIQIVDPYRFGATLMVLAGVAIVVVSYVLHRGVELRMRGFWFRIFDRTLGRLTDIAERFFPHRGRAVS